MHLVCVHATFRVAALPKALIAIFIVCSPFLIWGAPRFEYHFRVGPKGFVARIFLWRDYPLPQTDLAYGHGTRYAKSCEAVQDRGTDLDLHNLPIEVARREALTE